LVTVNWNLNDDVFTPRQVWQARSTPVDKPTNLEHDPTQHVGHINGCYAIDIEGKIIPDGMEPKDLPDTFHLINSAVIYLRRTEEYDERANHLVEEIKAGTKFVSMECLFSDFDYAMIDKDGNCQTVARNEETAFLTKHLRAYGGTGMYKDKKIGRSLKNMVFSGKGYVDRPANPESIILDQNSVFSFNSASFSENTEEKHDSGVSNNIEDNTSENIQLNNKESKMDLEKLQAENAELVKQLAEASAKVDSEKFETQIAEFETKVSELEAEVKAGADKLEAAKADTETAKSETETAKAELETVQTELTEVKASKAELDEQIAKAIVEKVISDRIATLTKGGVEEEKAVAKVELYKDLTDEQFEAIAADIVAAVPTEVEEKTEASDDVADDSEVEVDTEILEKAKSSVEDVVVKNTEDEVDEEAEVQDALQKGLAKMLGKKSK
ncbi:hypothetical protein KAR91_41510, partial [Candidatus Pacearchaeota archaeon]|nr:hypothetical protein [Candidatus Pacearchaeota archaeon]